MMRRIFYRYFSEDYLCVLSLMAAHFRKKRWCAARRMKAWDKGEHEGCGTDSQRAFDKWKSEGGK